MTQYRSTTPTWTPPETRGVRIPERSLQLLRDLVQAHTGMFYDEPRLSFLQDRLTPRVVECGFDSLLDYYYLLKYGPDAEREWSHAIDALSVQETYFWREFDQVRALVDVIVPRLAAAGRHRPIRIWSMPCATGEEPLSIAMALTEAGWFARAPIEIHASDASEAALARARAGRYAGRSFRQLPEALRARYFTQTAPGEWTIAPEIHARVASWTRVNAVRDDEVAAQAGADVVFCRNMFIYFDAETVRRVVASFAAHTPSPAFLCVGASESLLRSTTQFELQDIAGAYVYVKS